MGYLTSLSLRLPHSQTGWDSRYDSTADRMRPGGTVVKVRFEAKVLLNGGSLDGWKSWESQ